MKEYSVEKSKKKNKNRGRKQKSEQQMTFLGHNCYSTTKGKIVLQRVVRVQRPVCVFV